MNSHIALFPHLDLGRVHQQLQANEAGAESLFIGTVRNHAQGKQVLKLEFEAYEPMALAEMHKIAAQAHAQWPLQKVLMWHVLGTKQVGEPVVALGASSAHRAAAFEACRFLIEALKQTVPIWKKEYYTDSSIWVNAHP